MVITHSFLGGMVGTHRCYFYLLVQDYIDDERLAAQGFGSLLERLARDMRHDGAVVKAFQGDIDQTRNEVLKKAWTNSERAMVHTTPGLLVLSTPFPQFNPREDRWVYLRLRDGSGHVANGDEFEQLFSSIAKSVHAGHDILKEIQEAIRRSRLPSLGEVFEIKPEIAGCSINLLVAKDVLLASFRRMIGAKTT